MFPYRSVRLRHLVSYIRLLREGSRGSWTNFNNYPASSPSLRLISNLSYVKDASQSAQTKSPQKLSSAAQTLAGDALFTLIDLNACEIFSDVESMERNIKRRGMNFDLSLLSNQYRQLDCLLKEKLDLERQRTENAEIIKILVKDGKQDGVHINDCMKRGKDIKSRLKRLMDGPYSALQETVISEVLRLPVRLHRDASELDELLSEISLPSVFKFDQLNHETLENNKSSPEFYQTTDGSYYLSGELSKLERHLVNGLTSRLLASGLRKIICPDMVKSFVADRCSPHRAHVNADQSSTFSLEGTSPDDSSSLRLAGVSPITFAAFFASQNIRADSLPVKYFSVGRCYSLQHDVDCGLYGVRQSTSVDVFAAATCSDDIDRLFDEYSEIVYSIYKSLDVSCKFVKVGCRGLSQIETRQTDVFVWSSGYGRYFKCGSLSSYSDVVSRRMTTKYATDVDDTTQLNFAHTLHGTVVRLPSIIAGLIEHNQTKDGAGKIPFPRL